jgi:prevent-host-death family protein
MTTVTLKELRPNIPKLIDDIDKRFERVTVTRRGHPVAVMMSVDDYESLLETLDVLSDKAGLARIREGVSQVKHGRVIDLKTFRKQIEK